MQFENTMQKDIIDYCMRDLPCEDWYEENFNFVKNHELKTRLISEFKNARFIYKIFEGLSATDELLLAEVRMQVLMYASIYEATLHYVLFDEYYKNDPLIKELLVQRVNKPFSIPTEQLSKINTFLAHDGKTVIPYFETEQKREIEKIRFEEKCIVAFKIGLLTEITEQGREDADILSDLKRIDKVPTFCSELIRIYEVRNAIHLHAELKKEVEYHLQLSRIAYRRIQPFLAQIKNKLSQDGFL